MTTTTTNDRILFLMRERGMSAAELANEIGVNHQALKAVLIGGQRFRGRTLDRIASALGTSVTYLQGATEIITPRPPTDLEAPLAMARNALLRSWLNSDPDVKYDHIHRLTEMVHRVRRNS